MQPRIIPRSDHPISRKNIDPDALKVLYRLYRSGHTAFLVGGGVRDLLIGRRPKDFDICTSARPGQVKKLFRNCWLIGRRFRLAHIHFRDHKIVEVSTFRAQPEREGDGDEDLLVRQDNTFGSPEEDAMRRDFTINGLFYDIASFSLIDYVGGVEDIEAGVIRTIGDPHIRFQEDPVRMIRAIKFAARLDFAIEPQTWEALCEHVEDITKCSTSRVVEEIARLLEGGAACRSLQLLKASGLLRIVLPDVYEYVYGVPAGPGLVADSRSEARETPEALEEDLLLNADEDIDHEAQERILGVEGQPPEDDEAVALDGGETMDVEAGPLEEDEIDLSADDEGVEVELVTPQGTRCVQAPDRCGLLWRMLAAVDQRVRSGHPMTRPSLYASLYYPLIRHTVDWMVAQPTGRDEESAFVSLLRPVTATIMISRRDRERVCQVLAALRKFKRNNKGFAQALARKPYFAESLDVYHVSVLATGDGVEALQWWRDRYPYVAPAVMSTGRARPAVAEGGDGDGERYSRRSRRRRRGGEGRGGDRELSRGDDTEGGPRRRESRDVDRDLDRERDLDRDRHREGRDIARRDVRDLEPRRRESRDFGPDVDRPREPRRRDAHDLDREPRRREPRDFDREPRRRDARDLDREPRRRDAHDLDREPRRRESRDFDREPQRRDARDFDRELQRRESRDIDREPRRREARDLDRDYEPRRREARDVGRDLDRPRDGYARGRGGRGSSPRAERDLPLREARDTRNGSGRSEARGGGRSRERYREEGFRGPRGPRGDSFDYYESRVGRDLTPESPRPRRDDDRRRGRRRRRKPPVINR